ncbi:hypothetical protein VOLCADRAFT_94778, partial [Volvox carteri f. nagariensis]
ASAGLSYVFPVYAPALKELWGYHETQIATIGSCFNIGGYLAIPSGALFVALIGSLLLAIGYLGLFAAASGHVAPSFAFICVCAVLGGNSSTWFDTTAIVTNVRNFPRDRGTVVGILKAFVGLSASIYSSIYAATFASGGASAVGAAIGFLFFVGAVSPVIALALTTAINLVPEAYHEPDPSSRAGVAAAAEPLPPETPLLAPSRRQPGPSTPRFSAQARFSFAYWLVALVAVYQAGAALWAGAVHPTPYARRALLGGLLSLLALLLVVPLSSGDWVHRKPRPEAVERLKRSLLSRLAARGAKAAAEIRRSLTGYGNNVAAAADANNGRGNGDADLTEPLLSDVLGAGGNADGAAVTVLDRPIGAASSDGGKSSDATKDVLVALADPEAPPSPSQEALAAAAAAAAAQDEAGALAGPVVREGDLEAQIEALEKVPALPDLPLSAAVRSPLFWLLLFQFGVGLGTGLSYLNNLGSIVVALGGQRGGQVVFVSLFSVANATGRLAGGVLSELILRRYGIPRTLPLLASSCLTLIGVGGAAVSELYNLYLVSIIAGLAFGAHWGLIPAITSDLFGLSHFGSNYTALQLGPAAGGYLLATVLTGKLYDRVARRHGDKLYCVGADCYFDTWCVLGGLNLLALLGTRELYAQSVKRYRRLVRAGAV